MCRPASEAAMHVCNLATLPKILISDKDIYPNKIELSYKKGNSSKNHNIIVPIGQLVQYGKILDYYGKYDTNKADNTTQDDQKTDE